MGFLLELIFSFLADLVFGFVIQVFGTLTGHAVLFVVTLGNAKPSDEVACVVGLAFWAAIAITATWLLR